VDAVQEVAVVVGVGGRLALLSRDAVGAELELEEGILVEGEEAELEEAPVCC
jgi:hypothetical protein